MEYRDLELEATKYIANHYLNLHEKKELELKEVEDAIILEVGRHVSNVVGYPRELLEENIRTILRNGKK